MNPILEGILAGIGYIVVSYSVVGIGALYLWYDEKRKGDADDESMGA